MNEREELNDIFLDWYQTHFPGMGLVVGSALDDLKDRLLAAGFRKTLDVSELERFDGGVFDGGAMYLDSDGDWVRFEDARRLAAPKERWVPILITIRRFSFSEDMPGVIYPDPDGAACWFADVRQAIDPPPPTTPAQREGS